MPIRNEHSAGGVVVRTMEGQLEVALCARRTRKGDLAWGLPKGLVDPGESPEDTAIREVREETGLVAEIRAPLGRMTYWYWWDGVRVHKVVDLFLMEAVGGDTSQHDHEMEEIRWFPSADAVAAAAYQREREAIRRAVEALDAAG